MQPYNPLDENARLTFNNYTTLSSAGNHTTAWVAMRDLVWLIVLLTRFGSSGVVSALLEGADDAAGTNTVTLHTFGQLATSTSLNRVAIPTTAIAKPYVRVRIAWVSGTNLVLASLEAQSKVNPTTSLNAASVTDTLLTTLTP